MAARHKSTDFGLPLEAASAIKALEAGLNISSVDALTARAGGGQALGTALTEAFNRVTTVATIADSVKLPAAKAGMWVVAINAAANSMNVFPSTGETINAGAADAAFAVAGGKTVLFVCANNGKWYGILSA